MQKLRLAGVPRRPPGPPDCVHSAHLLVLSDSVAGIEVPMRLDGHLHIWSGDEEAFPYFRERGGSPNFNIPPVRARSRCPDG